MLPVLSQLHCTNWCDNKHVSDLEICDTARSDAMYLMHIPPGGNRAIPVEHYHDTDCGISRHDISVYKVLVFPASKAKYMRCFLSHISFQCCLWLHSHHTRYILIYLLPPPKKFQLLLWHACKWWPKLEWKCYGNYHVVQNYSDTSVVANYRTHWPYHSHDRARNHWLTMRVLSSDACYWPSAC